MAPTFDEFLSIALMEAGFYEIRRVEDHVEARRSEKYHPHIQFIWFACFENLPVVSASRDEGWKKRNRCAKSSRGCRQRSATTIADIRTATRMPTMKSMAIW